jgi:tRNA threonylcarbamoyladenosine biosynthesis protein TsaB
VQAVLVSRGPGSYTGLRVGVISAKAFAYATGCALLAIDTFAAIAEQAPREALRLDVLADAQQDKVYLQRFARATSADAWLPEGLLAIQPFAEWLTHISPSVWVSGPGVRGHEEKWSAGINVVGATHREPQAESLLRLGLARYRKGERDDLWSVEPLYLRPSAAEEKWQAR